MPATPQSHLTLPVSDRDRVQGRETANITLVEYGDYECPACAQAYQIIQAIQAQLGDCLRFVFRHFPCQDIHPHALHAAEAAEAAASQGKFWEMHECLLQHYQSLANGSLVEYAIALRLNVNQFLAEMRSDCHVARVQEDYESGVQSGVTQTPTFFINGIRHDGDWEELTLMATLRAQQW
jgi:protein-disulfide isomerase